MASKEISEDSQERKPCVFPRDLMNDVKENDTEHTFERGVTEAIPICQTN